MSTAAAAKTTQTAILPDGTVATRKSTLAASFVVAVGQKDGTGWVDARWSKTQALAEKFAATITPGYPTRIVPVTTAA